MMSDETQRAVMVLLGLTALNKLLPTSQEIALIMNGAVTYEDGVAEGRKPHSKAVIDEFIRQAHSMTKEELTGALFYAMPVFAREQARLEAEQE